MLDFWATWCGPCVQAIPHVQKLADKFADKPVTVVGINRDHKGSEKTVAKFIKKRKITFTQVADPDGKIARAYRVSGIPCMVFIDREGVIREARTGFGSGGEKSLARAVDKLLTGKTTDDDDDDEDEDGDAPIIVMRDDDVDEDDDDESAAKDQLSDLLKELNPDRLARGKAISGQFSGWNVRSFDVDGDGAAELIAIDFSGGIRIIASDGSTTRRIRFGRSTGGVGEIQPFRFDGKTFWLVSSARHYEPGRNRPVEFGLYSDEGKAVWKHAIKTPKGQSCHFKLAAGDLTGDGRPEIVVGLSVNKTRRTGNSTYSTPYKAAIAVYDWDGRRLAQRSAGQSIEHVAVTTPRDSDAPAQIIVITNSSARRFTLRALATDDDSASADAPQPPPGRVDSP